MPAVLRDRCDGGAQKACVAVHPVLELHSNPSPGTLPLYRALTLPNLFKVPYP